MCPNARRCPFYGFRVRVWVWGGYRLVVLQYHRGARQPQLWVFGMVELSNGSSGDMFLRFVESRDWQTLDPLVNDHLRPHSTVWSDQFKSYCHLSELLNVDDHQTVNHSQYFRDPETGVHTNAIEGLWGQLKLFQQRKRGISRYVLPGYVDEFWWQEPYGKTHLEAFLSLSTHIAEWYTCN